jgi:hypothetical protein
MTTWESKHDNPKYKLYKDVLQDGIDKIRKYYNCLNEKPAYNLALGLSLSMDDLKMLMQFQYCICITSLTTSRFPGVELKSRRLKWLLAT